MIRLLQACCAFALVLFTLCPAFAAELLGQWKFDQGMGTSCQDNSGHGVEAILREAI